MVIEGYTFSKLHSCVYMQYFNHDECVSHGVYVWQSSKRLGKLSMKLTTEMDKKLYTIALDCTIENARRTLNSLNNRRRCVQHLAVTVRTAFRCTLPRSPLFCRPHTRVASVPLLSASLCVQSVGSALPTVSNCWVSTREILFVSDEQRSVVVVEGTWQARESHAVC